MKKYLSPLAFTIVSVLLISVNYSFSQTQTLQAGATDQATPVTTVSDGIWENVASLALPSLDGAKKVMVIANFQTDVTSGNSNLIAHYQLTDGINSSAEILRTVLAKTYNDSGLGTVVHIFSYDPGISNKTFTLQHKRPEPGASKAFSSKANMVAIVIDDANNCVPNSVKSTADVTTTSTSFVQITGSKTDAIVLTKPGGIYITASFSTLGDVELTGSWVLRSSTDGTNFSDVPNATMSRSNTTDVGAATGTWLFENQAAGTYYYDVAHKTSTGTLTTRNLTLIAIGLVDDNSGNVYPTFKSTGGSNSTSSSTAVEASSTGALVSENATNSLFAHATFSMSASSIITAPEFSIGITNATFSPVSFTRYIPAGGMGSGGLVGLGTDLTLNGEPVVSLNHKSDGTNSLTTSNINLVGFQLKSSPSFATAQAGDWNTASTWSPNTIPTSSNTVVLSHAVTVAANGTANVYDLNTSSGNLTISSDASNSGSLIVSGTTTGNITYQRYMTGSVWHLVSSPILNQDIGDLLTNGTNDINLVSSDYDMTDYIESTDNWNSKYTSATVGNFTSGKGYEVKRASAGSISFTGAVQSSDLSSISITRDNFGWNLLGNPYPSAINATTEADDTNTLLSTANVANLDASYAALYLWDSSTSSYKAINNSGATNPTGTLSQDYIQAGQGFFVRAKDNSSRTFSITKTMQSHQPSVAFKSAPKAWPTIQLIAKGVATENSTIITFNSEMTRGLDISYDAGMLKGNPNFTLYSKLVEDNGVDFAIQCLPEDYEELVIPIGLDASIGETVYFSAETFNLPENASCYIEDRAANIFTQLSSPESYYSVQITTENIGLGNFYIHPNFKIGLSTESQEAASHKIITNQTEGYLRIIGDINPNSKAFVYDLSGRLQAEFLLNNSHDNRFHLSNLNRGIYLLQIINGHEIIKEKIFW